MARIEINLLSNSLIIQIAAVCLYKEFDYKLKLIDKPLKSSGRLFSINYSSQKLLDRIGIWENLNINHIIPYDQINVFSRSNALISFKANDINIKNLGFIVQEDNLVKCVADAISSIKPSPTKNISSNTLEIIGNLDECEETKNKIEFDEKDYHQTAVNIQIRHSKNNNLIPTQVFYEHEILGFLPMSNNEYNLIWSMPNDLNSKKLDSDDYISLLSKRADFLLGEIDELTIGKSFPLYARHAKEYSYANKILIGDCAHKFHPLAGLGLNMGIEDIICLINILDNYSDIRTLQREYAINRIHRNNSLQKTLDVIMNFYSSQVLSEKFKYALLNFFNSSFFMKSAITKEATGIYHSINK